MKERDRKDDGTYGLQVLVNHPNPTIEFVIGSLHVRANSNESLASLQSTVLTAIASSLGPLTTAHCGYVTSSLL
jgi:hypothetical protein